jgi:hypothetical protein
LRNMRHLLAFATVDRLRETLMTVLRLATKPPTERDVSQAQATYFAFRRAEAGDPRLLDDPAHRAAKAQAHERYLRLYIEWDG